MKQLQLILGVLLLTSTSLFAQKSKTNSTYSNHPPKNMRDFDWQGIYSGITNCANCAGLETTLELKKGNKFILTIKAIDKEDEPFVKKGKFKWEGDIIHLEGMEFERTASMYKISQFEAKQLYFWDNKIQGENWTEYTLQRVGIIMVIDTGRE